MDSALDVLFTLSCYISSHLLTLLACRAKTCRQKPLDLLVIVETWHEGCESAALKRSTPTGYKYVVAVRVISADAAIHDVNFQNHGGLAIVYRNTVVFQK